MHKEDVPNANLSMLDILVKPNKTGNDFNLKPATPSCPQDGHQPTLRATWVYYFKTKIRLSKAQGFDTKTQDPIHKLALLLHESNENSNTLKPLYRR